MNDTQISAQHIGKQLFDKNAVSNIFFSSSTYLANVFDETVDEQAVVFLQLNEKNEVSDYFVNYMSDEESDLPQPAILEAVKYAILRDGKPIHQLFKSSLWSALFFLLSKRHGMQLTHVNSNIESEKLQLSYDHSFTLEILDGELSKFIRDDIFNKEEETEENSIKFSNVSQKEVELYRSGMPSHEFKYELSFWSDISKELFVRDVACENMNVSFEYSENSPPTSISVKNKDIQITLQLSLDDWNVLMPFLIDKARPFAIHTTSVITLSSIDFYEDSGSFHIDVEKKRTLEKSTADTGEYVFVPFDGFYVKKQDPLLHHSVITPHKASEFLQRYAEDVEQHTQYTVDVSLHTINHTLEVDAFGTLHIHLYLFEKGDLLQEGAHYFKEYCFLPGKGFFKTVPGKTESLHTRIPKEKVSYYVSQNKSWLAAFEGFALHMTTIDTQLEYQVNNDGDISFRASKPSYTKGEVFDYGDMTYIDGEGFFPAAASHSASPLSDGLIVKKKDVSTFIDTYESELELIRGFFSRITPLSLLQLDILAFDHEPITTTPVLIPIKEYAEKTILLYSHYTYVKNEGFIRIPEHLLLPLGYEQERHIPSYDELEFFSHDMSTITPFARKIDTKLRFPKKLKLIVCDGEFSKETGKWHLDLKYESEYGSCSVFDVYEPKISGKTYMKTNCGLIVLKDYRFDWMGLINSQSQAKDSESIKLTSLEWVKINVFDIVDISTDVPAKSRELLQDLLNPQRKLEKPCLKPLQSTLRPYQAVGLDWLWHLYHNGLSGLLADEMGLGKTHQAMAIVAAIFSQTKDMPCKFIVVCPTSVIYHWKQLLTKFLPDITFTLYYGQSRSIEATRQTRILLTSYGTLRSDIEELSKVQFELAIFDEVQLAKNKQSLTHKSLKRISCGMRLGLTGTPIENYLLELKALFDVVIPGYLPSDADFKEQFIVPIEKQSNEPKRMLLRKYIDPFILRRRKLDVLTDLPEKIEEILRIDMSDDQKDLYKEYFFTTKARIDSMEQGDKASSFNLHVFALLNKLKQICNHPALAHGDVANYKNYESTKFQLCNQLIEEALESGQKVVLFTQYLGMIDIYKQYLDDAGVEYASIQGSTRNREEELNKFKENKECKVFIASLGAAGVGIDLVSASVVIHYDRWWNPARENQATDRVHRIGQQRGVQVFKLVTNNSVEEHIDQLIEKKLSLIQKTLGFDDESAIKRLDKDELIHLLQVIHKDATTLL